MRKGLTFAITYFIIRGVDSEEIKQLRNKLGLSQEQLAKRLGVSFVTVNRWENKKTKPSALAVEAIKVLGAETL